MTYTYDLTTAIGQVRFAIGDTVVNGSAFFADEEIQYALDSATADQPTAALTLLDIWSQRLSQRPKVVIGNYQEDWTAAINAKVKLAATLRQQIGDGEQPTLAFSGDDCAWL